MKGARQIFRFLLDAQSRGERTALATITGVTGSSPRAAGTHMAICASGAYRGSFSGGCTEAAVVGEALRVINSGRTEHVRLGAGSPYIDIRLPCGGGLDILIVPDPAPQVITRADELLARRNPIAVKLGADGQISVVEDAQRLATGWHGDAFLARHDPDLRLVIIGHGAEVEALAALSVVYGAEVVVLSPNAATVAAVERLGAATWLLIAPEPPQQVALDPFTAVAVLFHDHDWEGDLLAWALQGRPFFIGAMGSRETHARRLDALRKRGCSAEECDRIIGPVGLIPATRDPETLALSVLSQIAQIRGASTSQS